MAPVEAPNDRTVTVTTAMGRVTSYRTEQLATGVQRRTVTQPDGTVDVSLQRKDGSAERTASDGTVFTSRRGPEPRFGMQSPILTEATVVTPGGRTSTTTSGRTVTFLDPNGDKQSPSNVVSILDTVTINGRSISSTWTAATRTMSTVSPEGRQGSTRFDVYGRVEEASSPGVLPVGYAYDSFGRLETVTQGTRTTTYHYDAEGYVEWIRDPLGREVHFTYDDAGRVRTQRLPDLRVIGFTYDANGNLTSVTPPGRPAHGFDHDEVDRATLYDPPQVTGVSEDRTLYAYNLDHQLERVTRPDGQLVDYVYGTSTGRLDSVVTPRGTYGYSYHPTSGLLTSISDPDGGTLAFGYDGSLPTSVAWTGEVAGSIELVYDDDFEVTSQTVNGLDPILFAYDDDGLLTDAGDLALTSSATTGFLEGTTLGTATDSLTYTTHGELDVYTASAGSPVLTYDLDRDGGGRITKKTETIGGVTAVWEYRFDAAGRLDEVKKDGVVVETYGYDANSNRTSYADFWGSGSATYDEQDRLLTYGAASFTYTDNGELLTKTEGPDVTTYGYDVFGNLRTVELPTGIDIEYLVDAANRRIGKKVNGTLVQAFLWQSQLQPAAELDGAGNVVARFVYATKPNVPDYMVKGGITYRLFTDHLGSVRLVVNTTTGAIAQRIDYDPWGRILIDTNPGFQPFGFAGGIYDAQTGLVRFGARDYDPKSGRWTSKDPAGFAGDPANLFGYCVGDPVNARDPAGLWALWDDLAFSVGGALVGIGSQLFSDLISGELSGGKAYLNAALGGAAGGLATLYGGPVVGAAVGAGLTNALNQKAAIDEGVQCDFDFGSFLFDTAVGGISGRAFGASNMRLGTPRGSSSHVYKTTRARLASGTISNIQPATGAKMFAGAFVEHEMALGVVAGVGAAHLSSNIADAAEPACGCSW